MKSHHVGQEVLAWGATSDLYVSQVTWVNLFVCLIGYKEICHLGIVSFNNIFFKEYWLKSLYKSLGGH